MSATEYVKKLRVGWNLGNTLDSHPKHNKKLPFRQETLWGNPLTTKAIIHKVRESGFDMLRIPVSWYAQMGDAPDFVIKEEWLQRVKKIVDYGINLGMTVIVNLHHEDWHTPTDENYPVAKEQMKKVWTQIANYFESYDDKLIFESMNEPRVIDSPEEWLGGDEEGRRVVMQLNQDAVEAIRATGGNNSSRMIMVTNYASSYYEVAMADFEMPNDENLIMSIHAYVPYEFALGGDFSLNVWKEEYENDIDELFARIDKYFISKGIPVIMGECGARKKGDNEDARAKWAEYYTAKAREYGVPCLWWDNGPLDGPEHVEVFGLLNRNTVEWAYPKILKNFVT
ncbi:MAG: glycoside hydrolase family 5 protein [Clostridiales bacterium]|nr:glycoside hydrolase family 5 protein [Clostridiales bacterium]